MAKHNHTTLYITENIEKLMKEQAQKNNLSVSKYVSVLVLQDSIEAKCKECKCHEE